MLEAHDIERQLQRFTKTDNYYQLAPHEFYLTDGTKFLADNCKACWLMHTLQSITKTLQTDDHKLLQCVLERHNDGGATLSIYKTDQSSSPVRSVLIEYTDFPLSKIMLIILQLPIVNNEDKWICMLSTEY